MYNNIEWSISRMFREAKFPISDTQHGKQALTLLKLGGDIRIHFNPMKNTKEKIHTPPTDGVIF